MRCPRWPLALLLLTACDTAPAPPSAAKPRPATTGYFFAVTDGSTLPAGNGNLLKIDAATGAYTLVGNTGYQGLEDLAWADGKLLAVGYPGDGVSYHNFLIRINPKTGAATPIGVVKSAQTTYQFIEALATVDGILYGSASDKGSYCPDCSDHLITIDPRTGAATEVGPFGPEFRNIEAMAYSPKYGLIGADIGTLIGPAFTEFHTTPALVSIDRKTGQATKIADLPRDLFLCGLDFDDEGNLYASTFPSHFGGKSRLVLVGPGDGVIREVGEMGTNNVDGLLYVSPFRMNLR